MSQVKFGSITLPHGLALAPLAGVSDRAFRRVCRTCGADFTVSEMVSAKALCYEQRKKDPQTRSVSGQLASVMADELPMAVECKLLKFNEDGICIGDIVNVSADESVLDSNGKIDAKKLDPIIYDGATHAYWSFGEIVGKAFSDGKKLK